VDLELPGGSRARIPRYLVCKIEHAQGDSVILRDNFEQDHPDRQLRGAAQRSSDQPASGQASLRLEAPGDALEYLLPKPVGEGWFEARIWDFGGVGAETDWICEFEFSSPMGKRIVQVLLGWEAESYGLATPKGPSLPVQRLARRPGWKRLGLRHGPQRILVQLDDAVLTHADIGLGYLQAVRFLVRAGEGTASEAAPPGRPIAYIDDLQIARSLRAVAERQPSRDQDDLWLTTGDQLFGRVEAAGERSVSLRGEFGLHTLPWPELQAIHFSPQPCPSRSIRGLRVRARFTASAGQSSRDSDTDSLEGVLQQLSDDSIVLEHPQMGPVRILRQQTRELEFLHSGVWLAIDSAFHHFGDEVNIRLQLPHPEGNSRVWTFSLDQAPQQAHLVLYVVDMESMTPGGAYFKNLENDELRTYVSVNGQNLDPLGLNHLLPLNPRGSVRLRLPIAPGVLKQGENLLRLHQTPQKQDPLSFDDCGVFGIGLETSDGP
jgi:hypothetical protein